MLSEDVSSTIFWVFGMTRPGIKLQISQAIGEHSNYYANRNKLIFQKSFFFHKSKKVLEPAGKAE